jgi:hypothetical protein
VPHSTVPVPGKDEREEALRKQGAEMESTLDGSVDEKSPVEA